MKPIKIFTTSIISLLFAFTSCKKVKLPDSKTSELIGKWAFVSSSGGFSGIGNKSYNKNTTFEYTKYGKFKIYNISKLKDYDSFSFVEGYNRFNKQTEYLIKTKKNSSLQSFEIIGNILYLSEADGNEGFQYQLKRK